MKRIFCLVIIYSSLVFGHLSTLRAQINAEQVMTIGRNVLSMDDYMLSIQYFNQAIKAKPYLSDPYFYRALAKLYLEDYPGSEEDCSLAIERNNFKTESYKLRGFVRQNMGLDSLAVTDYDHGLSHNPHDKYFLFYKGVALTNLKRYAEADTTFETLLRYYPGFEEGLTARANLQAQQGDTISAMSNLDKAISISRNYLQAFLLRAELESKQGDWQKALQDLDDAIRLRPQEGDLYVNRAYLKYNLDDFFGAMGDYNYALQLDPENLAALFNRALLRYEVRDLDRATDDLKSVLALQPQNFHALYNLGLIELEQQKYHEALKRFDDIAKKYPRFYPLYYARAEALRGLGDMKKAIASANYAETLVKEYVRNPDAKPLDRPRIAAGRTHTGLDSQSADGSGDDNEVMERFNQLVTTSAATQTELSFNERIKGRVQDRDINVSTEPLYILTFIDAEKSLRPISNYFRELDEFNNRGYLPKRLFLAPATMGYDQDVLSAQFADARRYEEAARDGSARPVEWLALGIYRLMLKNYEGAIRALENVEKSGNANSILYMVMAAARQGYGRSMSSGDGSEESAADVQLRRRGALYQANEALADYDRAIAIDPGLSFAWYNKGNLLYDMSDYSEAVKCYDNAIRIDPEFGAAYFNRGLVHLRAGRRQQAFEDLRKAGELGVVPSYNLLKRMNR